MDLIHGCHLDLFFSDIMENNFKADWEAAKDAGADLQNVKFFSKEETHQVLNYIRLNSPYLVLMCLL